MSSHPLSVTIKLPNGVSYEQPTGLFINNKFVASKAGKTFETENPATEKPITSVYEALEEDVDAAVEAAEAAFETWSETQPAKRGELLYKIALKLEENADLLAAIESLDNGKALTSAQGDVGAMIEVFKYYAGFADKIHGTTIDTHDGFFTYTRREPLGVCGQIIPWNFPLLMWSWKIAPAIATGNTVVIKSAESTPLSALFASTLLVEAGLPEGVVNVISGFGATAGTPLAKHPKVRKIAFTGSTVTGKKIMTMAAQSNLKKVTLELGGKSPNIVFADADIDAAIEWAIIGIFFNAGEVCCAGSRIYVEESIYDTFLEKLKARTEKVTVGDPFDTNNFAGSQISKPQLNKILGYIESGHNEGARLITGGKRIDRPGYFVEPTVFADTQEHMKIVKEEIFGPVVVVTKFSSVNEVIKWANSSEYGLGAGIHTKDVNKAIDVSNRIHSGTVWVNCYNCTHTAVPFGGYKSSGFGRENGEQALDNYTQVKAVRLKVDRQN